MLRHDIAAGLFAPIEFLMFENESAQGTVLVYDLPSSVMVVEDNPPLLEAAKALDRKFAELVERGRESWRLAFDVSLVLMRPLVLAPQMKKVSCTVMPPAALRTSVEEMALDAVVFIRALGLSKVDLLGFSLGGFIAQVVAQKQGQKRTSRPLPNRPSAGQSAIVSAWQRHSRQLGR
jgi:pimeloyl-ACP methyl ester carboxylesterase